MRIENLLILSVCCSTPFLFVIGQTQNLPLISASMGFAFFYFASQPVQNSLVAKYATASVRSSAYVISFLIAFGVGSFASSLSGWIAENIRANHVFTVTGIISALAVMVAVLVRIASDAKISVPKEQFTP